MAQRTLQTRDVPGALLAGARWLVNPVSEGGAKQVPRFKLLAAGPEVLREVERMRVHPTGKRLLADKPDLGALLSSTATLKSMRPGSLGRTFHDAMEIPGGVPGYLLASLIYKDGFFDSLEVSDDVRYFIERSRWLHDLFHVVTGYGTDLSGEGLLIYFMLGYEHGLSKDLLAEAGIVSEIFKPISPEALADAAHDAIRKKPAPRASDDDPVVLDAVLVG